MGPRGYLDEGGGTQVSSKDRLLAVEVSSASTFPAGPLADSLILLQRCLSDVYATWDRHLLQI